jgi:hypothetical protein
MLAHHDCLRRIGTDANYIPNVVRNPFLPAMYQENRIKTT